MGDGEARFLSQWVQFNQKKKNLRIGMMLAVEGGFVELGDGAKGGDVGGGAEGGFVEPGDGVEGGDVGGGTEGGGAKWSSTRIWDWEFGESESFELRESESENDKWEKWKPKREDENNRGKFWGWKSKGL